MKTGWLDGVFRPIPTPFDEHGELALGHLRENLAWGRNSVIRGFVLLGSNGEAVHLTHEERRRIIEAVRGVISEDETIIAGTGAMSTRQTIALTLDAARAGANAAMVLPPSYYRSQMTGDALQAHYAAVAEASPIPIVIYNVPACTGIDLDAAEISRLAEHENIVGLKASTGNVVKLATLRQTLGDDFCLLAGSAGFLLPALVVGADAAVLALANLAPRECADLYQAARNGDLERAQGLQLRLVALNTAVTARWGVAGLKEAMDQIGLYGGPVRRPLLPVSREVRSALTELLRATGLLRPCPNPQAAQQDG